MSVTAIAPYTPPRLTALAAPQPTHVDRDGDQDGDTGNESATAKATETSPASAAVTPGQVLNITA